MSYSQSNSTHDVIAVFDSNFNQLFVGARPIKASVERKAKLMKHPVESGQTVEDFRVIEPIKIKLEVVLTPTNYQNSYSQLVQVFLADNLIEVQTKVGVFPNMALAAIPHREDPAHFDTIKMTLDFEEVIIVTTSSSPLPQNAVTTSGGSKSGTPATPAQTKEATSTAQSSSVLYNSGKYLGVF